MKRWLGIILLLFPALWAQAQSGPRPGVPAGGGVDSSQALWTLPVKADTSANTPATCAAQKELFIKTDAPAGQQLFICNSAGNGWVLVGDGGGAGGGDSITVNTNAVVDADFDDATPSAPSNGFNVKWQKDGSSPANISAYLDTTTVGTTTFGSGSGFTWTFNDNVGTDPTVAFNGSGGITFTAGGTNQDITAAASGTGTFVVPGASGDNKMLVRSGPAIASFSANSQSYINGALNSFHALNSGRTKALMGLHESNGTGNHTGVYGVAESSHTSGTKGVVRGVAGDAYHVGAGGTVTSVAGLASYAGVDAGTVASLMGVLVSTNYKSAGTVNTNYGIFVDDQAGVGTANYSIYTQGTAPARFGGAVNAVSGFQVNGAATSGRFLRGDGSNFVLSSGAASGTGSCTNQFVRGLNDDSAPTCATVAKTDAAASFVHTDQANTYSGGGLQDMSANKLALPAATTLPGTCTTNKEIYVDTDATPAGQQVYLCNSTGNGWNLIGDGGAGGGGDNISVNGVAASDADFDDATPAAPAGGFNVKWQKDALTPNNVSAYVDYGAGLNVSGSELVADLAAAGTAGIAAYNAGTATTIARSDHTHRNFATLSWFFPGQVVTGIQTARALVPEGVTNCTIINSRITVNTTSGGASSYNIQRCTGGAGNCSTTANIYGSNVTLNASTESVAGGAPTTATITAGDAFRVNLTGVGSSLADVTVAMTYKCEGTN